MNISKFTQKSVQAVQNLEKVAYEYGNQEVEQEHLLYALLTQEDSLILKLIEKMEINKEYFINTVKKALDAKVKVSGGDLRFGQIFSKGSRIDISAFSSECIDFFLRQQTYLSVPVTSMRITLDSLVRTQPCGIQRFFLRASFFADTDGCNCACLYCLFHHYPPICTICLFSVIFSLVSKQCICGFARITRCSSSRICS